MELIRAIDPTKIPILNKILLLHSLLWSLGLEFSQISQKHFDCLLQSRLKKKLIDSINACDKTKLKDEEEE
jgi:hypothetical protein